ncbi:MAG: septation protein SpoVG family protein [Suipraeoptans sp.]
MSEYYIEAKMTLSEKENEVAFGTVTVDNCIKFPVQVREYMDKETTEKKWFLSYPRKTNGEGEYEDVVYPSSVVLRQEIYEAVMITLKYDITKDVCLPDVEKVHMTVLNHEQSHTKALATITINGLVLKGISVVEGSKGLFVKMPQFMKSDGEYKDIVYGTSKAMQDKITTNVLQTYDKKLQSKNQERGAR